ncbi:MAG: hypothetical protein R3B90_07400 [Planctomycetaceae bacterium]
MLHLGTDEAGYGPNLGPLVVTVSVWETADDPDGDRGESVDLWTRLESAITQLPERGPRLHVADSKQVYTPGRGLRELERSVLAILAQLGWRPGTLSELRDRLTGWTNGDRGCTAGWYTEVDVTLPVAAAPESVSDACSLLQETLRSAQVRLASVHSDVVCETRFNRLVDAAGSKGTVLADTTLSLVTATGVISGGQRATIHCDKFGGRNRYVGELTKLADGEFVRTIVESQAASRYEVGRCQFSFETKGERHLPVAVASMVSKYVRELSMLAVNTYWRQHLPDLKPTKGYPQDAARYFAEIRETQITQGLPDDMVWRKR